MSTYMAYVVYQYLSPFFGRAYKNVPFYMSDCKLSVLQYWIPICLTAIALLLYVLLMFFTLNDTQEHVQYEIEIVSCSLTLTR